MRCSSFWQRLAAAVAACPEAQRPNFAMACSRHRGAGNGYNGSEWVGVVAGARVDGQVGWAAWQVACLLSVFDAVPIGTHTAPLLQSAARRGLAAAEMLSEGRPRERPRAEGGRRREAGGEAGGGGGGELGPSYQAAAAMVMWSRAALSRACTAP